MGRGKKRGINKRLNLNVKQKLVNEEQIVYNHVDNNKQEAGMKLNFTVYIERDPKTKLLIGEIPGIAGAHTHAETVDELMVNLKEVLELIKPELKKNLKNLPHFVGMQEIEVGI